MSAPSMSSMGAQDPAKLLQWGTMVALSLTFGPAGVYDFPLMLFGVVANEMTSTSVPLQTFTVLLLPSAIFDLLNIGSRGFFTLLLTLVLLGLKLPLYFAVRRVLAERGADVDLARGYGGLVGGLRGGIGGARDMWNERRAAAGGYQEMPGNFGSSTPPPYAHGAPGVGGGASSTAQPAHAPRFPSSGGNVLGSGPIDGAGEGDAGKGNGAYQV